LEWFDVHMTGPSLKEFDHWYFSGMCMNLRDILINCTGLPKMPNTCDCRFESRSKHVLMEWWTTERVTANLKGFVSELILKLKRTVRLIWMRRKRRPIVGCRCSWKTVAILLSEPGEIEESTYECVSKSFRTGLWSENCKWYGCLPL